MKDSLFHMVRVLTQKGLNIEEYCQQTDTNSTGRINKMKFTTILRNIGLPFSPKDLNEIILQYAIAPTLDIVDYYLFLSDAGNGNNKFKYEKNELDLDFNNTDLDGSIQTSISSYTKVIIDVKRMLIESGQRLGKHIDEIYCMFGKWDPDGSGTITAAQFLRVLVRLHVDLSDESQDFLVDLLDTTSMGRIDFESLLDYCFSDNINNTNNSNNTNNNSSGSTGSKSPQPNGSAEDEIIFTEGKAL